MWISWFIEAIIEELGKECIEILRYAFKLWFQKNKGQVSSKKSKRRVKNTLVVGLCVLALLGLCSGSASNTILLNDCATAIEHL